MQLNLITNTAQLAALETEWNELLAASEADNVFLTWEWAAAWLRWFGADYQLWVATARREGDGRLLGLAPLVIRRRVQSGLLPYRELTFLGDNEAAPDHLDFIVRREGAAETAAALAQYVWDNRGQWDVLFWRSAAEGAAATHLRRLAPARWQEASEVICPFAPLPASWEAFRQRLGKNMRYNINRYDRKLAEAGEMCYAPVTDPAELPEALAALRRLHVLARREDGAADVFWHGRMRSFQEEIAARFLEKGWLRFYRLQLDGREIGLTYNFQYGGKLYYYMTGYDDAWRRYGPGRQIMAYTIRRAIEAGLREIDFLRGEEAYKFDWAAQTRATLRLRLAAGRRGRLLLGARRGKAALLRRASR